MQGSASLIFVDMILIISRPHSVTITDLYFPTYFGSKHNVHVQVQVCTRLCTDRLQDFQESIAHAIGITKYQKPSYPFK